MLRRKKKTTKKKVEEEPILEEEDLEEDLDEDLDELEEEAEEEPTEEPLEQYNHEPEDEVEVLKNQVTDLQNQLAKVNFHEQLKNTEYYRYHHLDVLERINENLGRIADAK